MNVKLVQSGEKGVLSNLIKTDTYVSYKTPTEPNLLHVTCCSYLKALLKVCFFRLLCTGDFFNSKLCSLQILEEYVNQKIL